MDDGDDDGDDGGVGGNGILQNRKRNRLGVGTPQGDVALW
ncbi:hypothetical protein SUNI508_02914 [Seiridium unicorne]|uniref:Uncharacterized protein n=1 Tax=Seiridium unicorne TaxID=138068 RepID=A0ABR2VHP7_9PEZI